MLFCYVILLRAYGFSTLVALEDNNTLICRKTDNVKTITRLVFLQVIHKCHQFWMRYARGLECVLSLLGFKTD